MGRENRSEARLHARENNPTTMVVNKALARLGGRTAHLGAHQAGRRAAPRRAAMEEISSSGFDDASLPRTSPVTFKVQQNVKFGKKSLSWATSRFSGRGPGARPRSSSGMRATCGA